MAEIKIREIDKDKIEKIDEIAKQRHISRNTLLLEILDMYLDCKDKKFQKFLPKIVESEVATEIEKLESTTKNVMNLMLICTLRLNKTVERLNDYLFPEIEKLNIGGLTTEQIISLLNDSEQDLDEEYLQNLLQSELNK